MAPQNQDYFSQFDHEQGDDYFSQFEHEPKLLALHQPDKLSENVNKIADNLPKPGNHPLLRRFLYGPSKEDLGGVNLNAPDADIEIPGVKKASKGIENYFVNKGNFASGFAGGILGYLGELASKPLGWAAPGEGPISKLPEAIESGQKLLPRGHYTVNPLGDVYGGEQIPRTSMRESLGGKDILSKPVKSEKIGEPIPVVKKEIPEGQPIDNVSAVRHKTEPTASNYINAVKSGEIDPKEVSFADWRNSIPQNMAAAEGGKIKIGADIESLGKVLGSSLYQGDFPKIATKELLQNSIDATRHLGKNAQIDVQLRDPGTVYQNDGYTPIRDSEGNRLKIPGSITVSDNGNGMSRKELETVFTDLGASGKRSDANAVGGFGLAKAAPLLGGEKVKVISRVIENGMLLEHSFEGTPEELLRGVNISTRKLDPSEGIKTGTTVTTYFPKDQNTYYAKQIVKNIAKNSSSFEGKINLSRGFTDNSKITNIENDLTKEYIESPSAIGKTIQLNHPAANMDLMFPANAQYAERPGIVAHILNNGMYQGDVRIGGWESYPNVPDRIHINVKSNVPEGHPDYPFTANREALRGPAQEMVEKYIKENVIQPGINARLNSIKEAYNRMPQVNGIHYYDVGNKFTPEEFNGIVKSPRMQGLASYIKQIGEDALHLQANPAWTDKLERIGIIFDDKLRGIHIPNPGAKKSAVMINPFQNMLDRAPDEASAGILHTILHELAHVEGGGHDEGFAVRLADVYTKYGAENAVTAQRAIRQAIAGNGNEYLPEFQDLLSKYSESRGREATIDDPLYRTGIGSRDSKRVGKGKIPSNPKSSSDGFDSAVSKLLDSLKQAVPLREEQEAIYSAERSERFSKFMGVKTAGKKGAIEQLGKLKGEHTKVGGVDLKLKDTDVDQLFNLVRNSPRITPGEKAKGYTGLLKLLEGGNVPQRSELSVLDRVFGPGFGQQIIEMHGGLGAVNLKLGKTANTMKTLNATLDLSAPFRQGLGLVHRKEFWNAFSSMFKYAGSEKAFIALGDAIEAHPNYLLSRDAGLFLADHGLGEREEQFLQSYIGDLESKGPAGKLLTSPIRASERAYVGFLNKLRFDTFNSMLGKLTKMGYKPDQVSGPLAKYINVSTGRGELGKATKYGDALNTVLFSPRLISSRLTILNPKYYVDAPDYLRKDAIKSLLSIAGFVGMADTLGSMAGGKLKDHSLSSDFGKIKFGNTRLDPGGGFLQYIVLASRLIQGKTESSSGKTYDFAKNSYNAPNRWSLLFGDKNAPGFIESKFSPMASFVSGMLRGKDFSGQPFNVNKELRDRFTPLIVQDIRDVIQSDPSLLPLAVPGSFGMGLQTYQTRQKGMSLGAPSMDLSMRP